MDAKNELEEKINRTFDAVERLEKLAAPNSTYEQVMRKINISKTVETGSNDYLKWAAVGLIILVNTFSYIKYQEPTNDSKEYQVSDLASDYGLDSYAYSEY